ncbi:non-homologous end joining protein Ku [Aliihoeflea sp. PC F10.4]
MAPRAIWKGHLKVGELACAVALYSAATTSERISFHILNRKTGNRVKREYVDADTGKPVEIDDQVKGYETSKGKYVLLDPEEIAAATPESDKTLSVEHFIACPGVDTVYFDKPYYLAPADDASQEVFGLIREGMEAKGVAALATAVLFRRVRTLLIHAQGRGLIADTLNFDYEVRAADKAFDRIPELNIKGEMLDLAKHIIKTKSGKFDPAGFDDRYDAALADLVKAKLDGKVIEKPKREAKGKVIDLMEALRESAGKKASARRKPKTETQKRKAS